jgi:hypothetical protein
MSLARPDPESERHRSPNRVLPVGVSLLAVSCAVVILLSAFSKVQDSFDRTH